MAPPERRYLVVGDLGGTNGRLSLRDAADGAQIVRRDYLIAKYAKLDDMLRQFLEDTATAPAAVSSAVLAVCGPVTERGRWNLHNNSHWIAAPNRAGDIEAALGLAPQTLLFLNDFEANGYALTALFPVGGASDAGAAAAPVGLLTLHDAKADAAAPFACVGAGTGLGCVYGVPHADPLTGAPRGYTVCPSEAGMANSICPASEAEWGLLRYLQGRYATPYGSVHVDVERIVSGPGLVDCYRYHGGAAGTGEGDDDGGVTPEVVAERARVGGDAAAAAAVADFMTFYGRVLSTAACGFLPYAGLFIAGGILPKLRWAWTRRPAAGSAADAAGASWEVDPDCALLRAYRDAGPKMAPLVAAVPLVLVDDPDIGLKGCLAVAAQRAAAAAAKA